VGKTPRNPPQLPHERVQILQPHAAVRRVADVGQKIGSELLVSGKGLLHEPGRGRVTARVRVVKGTNAAALVETQAPAVLVNVDASATVAELAEAHGNGGWLCCVDSENLAHQNFGIGVFSCCLVVPTRRFAFL